MKCSKLLFRILWLFVQVALQTRLTACAQTFPQNPAGMTQLPRPGSSLALERPASNRQALSGDMAPFDRDVLKSAPLNFGVLLKIATMKPLTLDANYNRPISLKEALTYGLQNNLSIKISEESLTYYNSQFYNYLSYFAPSLSSSFQLSRSSINSETAAHTCIFTNVLTFPVFNGGNHYLFAVAQNYRRKGWRLATFVSINDELLSIYKKYTALVLNHQILRIRIKAIELSQIQLEQKQLLFKAGRATLYDIRLAEAELDSDTQALIAQQATTRKSSLDLSYELNMPLDVNLVPTSIEIGNESLIKGNPNVNKLIKIAFDNRPELREYEFFRQASARDVQIGMSNLYPSLSLFLACTRSSLSYSGNSSGLNGLAVTQISSYNTNNSNGTASNNALGQTANFSASSSSSSEANTASASSVASSGGTPMSMIQSGTYVTSGSVAPSIISPATGGGSLGGNLNGSNTATASVPGVFNSLQAGVTFSWNLPNFGASTSANMVSLRNLSRRALLQANRQLLQVENQVRTDYTNALSVLGQIENSGSLLDTNEEALRMSQTRLKAGIEKPVDYEQAKTTYLNGLEAEAQSLVSSKQAQAQLLHDLGVISIETLTKGFSVTDIIPKRGKI